ncbi:MAG: T9SS type A sorting domain-containing protein, partial [Crocinitomix sp.]|nr:T9SS type A sorting domain-containing protein [Crocinitomix sp.]
QANINIVNMNGQVAQNETITLAAGTSTMEVSSLATGVYVVSIQVNGAVINRKISIQ